MYKNFGKNFIDRTIALIIFIIFSPVIIICALVLSIQFKGSPFFTQKRPGLNEGIFNIFKFRTMNNQCDEGGNLLPDSQRTTILGAFMRRFSLDELPQLINVIKGDMSLIGPRPLLIDYLPLYNNIQKKRHLVKPGITGWAQVNGRNAISWEQKFDLDVFYVENISFLLDLKIFVSSIKKVLTSDNINHSKTITMEPFTGN